MAAVGKGVSGVVKPAEAECVARACQGDRQAFGELVRLHQGAVLATARHFLKDPERAREAAQESFLRAWAARETFGGRGSFRAWLLSILRNLCRDRLRARSRRPVLVPETGGVEAGVPFGGDRELRRAEQRQALESVLGSLSERQRLALLLAGAEGCSAAEIAAALDCKESTARATLFQARKKALRVLERHMETRGIAPENTRESLLGI